MGIPDPGVAEVPCGIVAAKPGATAHVAAVSCSCLALLWLLALSRAPLAPRGAGAVGLACPMVPGSTELLRPLISPFIGVRETWAGGIWGFQLENTPATAPSFPSFDHKTSGRQAPICLQTCWASPSSSSTPEMTPGMCPPQGPQIPPLTPLSGTGCGRRCRHCPVPQTITLLLQDPLWLNVSLCSLTTSRHPSQPSPPVGWVLNPSAPLEANTTQGMGAAPRPQHAALGAGDPAGPWRDGVIVQVRQPAVVSADMAASLPRLVPTPRRD